MEKPSEKHHYLPQCYLKGFLNQSGEIFVYDKQEKKFFMKKNTRDIFHENHRNSFTDPSTGRKKDMLEKLYAFFDDDFAPLLKKIIDSKHFDISLSFEEKLELMIGLCMLYWRVPAKDAQGRELLQTQGFNKGFIHVTYKKTGKPIEDDILQKVARFSGMEGIYKMGISFAPFYKKEAMMNVLNWRFLYQDPGFYITGDDPILKREAIRDIKDILNEFIFPVSSGRLLICSKEFAGIQSIDRGFCLKVGIAIVEQAHRFVCARDGNYLRTVVDLHRQSRENLDRCGGRILDYLFCKNAVTAD